MLLLVGSMTLGISPVTADEHCLSVPSAEYPTIQSALNAAVAGDTVCVDAGTFIGPVTIPNVDDLTLKGAGSDLTVIDADEQATRGVNAEFSPSAPNSGLRLIGFTLTGSSQFGVKLAFADGVVLHDVHATENARTGIDLNTVSDVRMFSVSSTDNGGNGIAIRNADGVKVLDASVAGNSWGGLAFYAVGTETVSDVVITSSSFADEGKGIYFQYGGMDKYTGIQIGVRGAGNTFASNGAGVLVEDHPTFGTPDASGIVIRGNDFTGNTIGVANQGTGTLDASGNYWGIPTGPALLGDPVDGDVSFTPWCLLSGCLL